MLQVKSKSRLNAHSFFGYSFEMTWLKGADAPLAPSRWLRD